MHTIQSIRRVFAGVACFTLFAGRAGAQALPETIVLKAARMITIASSSVVADAAIVVTGEKIVAAGRASDIS
ncbi:MAG TPA: hypothetical protein VHM24_10355, partial [Gemmatimonadaceae bacterium]|nr:hypothetical protein [Gemmatimonadaceae bacterium]